MLKETEEIYNLVKEINALVEQNNEDKLKKKSLQLNVLIAKHFSEGNGSIIDEAVSKIFLDKNELSKDIIEEEVDFEIENLMFEESGQEYDSTMFLTPCIVISKEDSLTIPSLNNFEATIRRSLIDKGLIQQEQQFQVGTIRLAPDDIEFMSSQDWWNVHRDIIDEADYTEEEKNENDEIRNSEMDYSPESFVSLFYFVTTITNKDSNADICEALYESQFDADFWASIATKLSNETAKFTILPPLPIKESIENSNVIAEMVNFEFFFDIGAYEENVDIAYAKTDDENKYVVLFFDEETKFLERFYLYDTYGDSEHFVCNLIGLCMNQPIKNLYQIDEQIKIKVIEQWKEKEDIVDINEILTKANKIDLEESYKFCSIDGEQLTNPTIH